MLGAAGLAAAAAGSVAAAGRAVLTFYHCKTHGLNSEPCDGKFAAARRSLQILFAALSAVSAAALFLVAVSAIPLAALPGMAVLLASLGTTGLMFAAALVALFQLIECL